MFLSVTSTETIILETNIIINITTSIIIGRGPITTMAITSQGISKNTMVIFTRTMITKGIKNVDAMAIISIVIVDMVDLTSDTGTSVWDITGANLL